MYLKTHTIFVDLHSFRLKLGIMELSTIKGIPDLIIEGIPQSHSRELYAAIRSIELNLGLKIPRKKYYLRPSFQIKSHNLHQYTLPIFLLMAKSNYTKLEIDRTISIGGISLEGMCNTDKDLTEITQHIDDEIQHLKIIDRSDMLLTDVLTGLGIRPGTTTNIHTSIEYRSQSFQRDMDISGIMDISTGQFIIDAPGTVHQLKALSDGFQKAFQIEYDIAHIISTRLLKESRVPKGIYPEIVTETRPLISSKSRDLIYQTIRNQIPIMVIRHPCLCLESNCICTFNEKRTLDNAYTHIENLITG